MEVSACESSYIVTCRGYRVYSISSTVINSVEMQRGKHPGIDFAWLQFLESWLGRKVISVHIFKEKSECT